ncbi:MULTISPECIES: hypothetical protein [unclassified Burkholderia]|uniref:hypothetical protein n=1 Tax=unclassified Burkholderia TaxID=2613784 RepID=UPI002AAF3EE1|nr:MULTISPECIES: hypothetical protein [unclassified Burkholderia]
MLRAGAGAIDGRGIDARRVSPRLPCCTHRPPEPIADINDPAAEIAHTSCAACNACFGAAAVWPLVERA